MSDPTPRRRSRVEEVVARRRRMRYRVDDTPDGRRVIPIEPVELTPEQQAALVEFGRKLAENMQQLVDALNQLGVACVVAQRNIEAMRVAYGDDVEWGPDTPPLEFGNLPT